MRAVGRQVQLKNRKSNQKGGKIAVKSGETPQMGNVWFGLWKKRLFQGGVFHPIFVHFIFKIKILCIQRLYTLYLYGLKNNSTVITHISITFPISLKFPQSSSSIKNLVSPLTEVSTILNVNYSLYSCFFCSLTTDTCVPDYILFSFLISI